MKRAGVADRGWRVALGALTLFALLAPPGDDPAQAQQRSAEQAGVARPAAASALTVRQPYLRTERVQECLKIRGFYTAGITGDPSVATSRAVQKLLVERDPALLKTLGTPRAKSPELIHPQVQFRLGEACRQVLAEIDRERARNPDDACGTGATYSATRKACVCISQHERVAGHCLPKVATRPAIQSARQALPAPALVPAAQAPRPVTAPQVQDTRDAAAGKATPQFVAPEPAPVTCLPSDLRSLHARQRGQKSAIPACELPCLALPAGMPPEDLRQYEQHTGVAWCSACVPFSAYLPLEDIERLETAGRIAMCRQAPRSALMPDVTARSADGARAFRGARALFMRRQPAIPHGNLAVIVTQQRYRPGISGPTHAARDGAAMRVLLTERLGYQNDNVVELKDTTLNDLMRIFGASGNPKGELWDRFQSRTTAPGATLLVYVAGLGVFRSAEAGAMILAVDAERGREEASGYPLSRLIDNLGRLGAPSATVILEVDFNRNGGQMALPPNMPEASERLLASDPKGALTVITAADRDQRTLEDPEYGLGLFTRHLIAGLSGEADLAPIGNGDNAIDATELFIHTAYRVGVAARRSFGMTQKPTLFRPHSQPIARLSGIVN